MVLYFLFLNMQYTHDAMRFDWTFIVYKVKCVYVVESYIATTFSINYLTGLELQRNTVLQRLIMSIVAYITTFIYPPVLNLFISKYNNISIYKYILHRTVETFFYSHSFFSSLHLPHQISFWDYFIHNVWWIHPKDTSLLFLVSIESLVYLTNQLLVS